MWSIDTLHWFAKNLFSGAALQESLSFNAYINFFHINRGCINDVVYIIRYRNAFILKIIEMHQTLNKAAFMWGNINKEEKKDSYTVWSLNFFIAIYNLLVIL